MDDRNGILYLEHKAPGSQHLSPPMQLFWQMRSRNNRPLYGKMKDFNPGQVAREFNVIANNRLKNYRRWSRCIYNCKWYYISRVQAISSGKMWILSLLMVLRTLLYQVRISWWEKKTARLKLKSVAEAVLGYSLPDDCMFIANSGRYEFRNKGVRYILLDSLGALIKRIFEKQYVRIYPGCRHTDKGPARNIESE